MAIPKSCKRLQLLARAHARRACKDPQGNIKLLWMTCGQRATYRHISRLTALKRGAGTTRHSQHLRGAELPGSLWPRLTTSNPGARVIERTAEGVGRDGRTVLQTHASAHYLATRSSKQWGSGVRVCTVAVFWARCSAPSKNLQGGVSSCWGRVHRAAQEREASVSL